MKNIEDLNIYENLDIDESIEIAGFKGKINDVEKTLKKVVEIKNSCCDGCIIQLMDAKAIFGRKHLIHAIIHGILAFKRKENLANDLGIEICLRTSAQRQISKSFDMLGLKKGEMDIAIVLINCPDYFLDELSNIFTRDDSVLDANSSILKEIYEIPEKELDIMNIEDILIDRSTELIVEI